MNLTGSPDSDFEFLSQTETIITPVLTFSKTKQFHKMTIFSSGNASMYFIEFITCLLTFYVTMSYESTNFLRKSFLLILIYCSCKYQHSFSLKKFVDS